MTAEPIFIDGALTTGPIHPLTMIGDIDGLVDDVVELIRQGYCWITAHSAGTVLTTRAAQKAKLAVHLVFTGGPVGADFFAATRWAAIVKWLRIIDLTGMDRPLPAGSTVEVRLLPDFFVSGNPCEWLDTIVRHYNCFTNRPKRALKGQTYASIRQEELLHPDKPMWVFDRVTSDGFRIMVPSYPLTPAWKIVLGVVAEVLQDTIGRVAARFKRR